MKNLTMNPTSVTMEYIIKSAIYENKMELITPSREYTDKEVAYIKGYIQSLEDMLEEFTLLNKEDLASTYKICLN
jgi:cellobiose phosphorylase